jgi:4-hydroxybenzoate polyprenyltransferase
MGNTKNRILEHLRLLRLQTAAATASAPLIGGLVMNQRDPFLLFVLFLTGILYHIFGFVLNEYIDIEADKKSDDLKEKPLVSGSITKKHALFIVVLSCICACALIVFTFQSVFPLSFFISALLLGGIYDVYGKKIHGSDFVLAGGFFFLCLTGASTTSTSFTTLVYIICLLYYFQIVFNNAIEGGLKDINHDTLGGVKNLAARMGVNIRLGKLHVTKSFALFAFCLRIVFIALLVLLGLQMKPSFWSEDYIFNIVIVFFLVVVLFATLYKFLQCSKFDREKMKKLFSVHEMTSYFMILVVLLPILGLQITAILLLLPVVWYLMFNIVLYGNLLQPQI